jgi:hypothetical protein
MKISHTDTVRSGRTALQETRLGSSPMIGPNVMGFGEPSTLKPVWFEESRWSVMVSATPTTMSAWSSHSEVAVATASANVISVEVQRMVWLRPKSGVPQADVTFSVGVSVGRDINGGVERVSSHYGEKVRDDREGRRAR